MGLRKKFARLSGLESGSKSAKILKLGATTPGNPFQLQAGADKDVTGMRGSARNLGRSTDKDKEQKLGQAAEEGVQQQVAAAAAAAAAEEPFNLAKESQRKGLLRKGRRASILTSSQGAGDPLGIPG